MAVPLTGGAVRTVSSEANGGATSRSRATRSSGRMALPSIAPRRPAARRRPWPLVRPPRSASRSTRTPATGRTRTMIRPGPAEAGWHLRSGPRRRRGDHPRGRAISAGRHRARRSEPLLGGVRTAPGGRRLRQHRRGPPRPGRRRPGDDARVRALRAEQRRDRRDQRLLDRQLDWRGPAAHAEVDGRAQRASAGPYAPIAFTTTRFLRLDPFQGAT